MLKGMKRKCRGCKEKFITDFRTRQSQRYCSKEECRRQSKAASQRRWLRKPDNRHYFRGPENVERVRCWRAAHPERAQRRTKPKSVLQDMIVEQPIEITSESGDFAESVLQDVMTSQQLVLIGLIAKITDSTLQDEIACTSRSLLRLGQDVLRGVKPNEKESVVPRAAAAGAAPI
jgi:hypothetical protein